MKLDQPQRELLVHVLAVVDTVFTPHKHRRSPLQTGAALDQLRSRYASHGIPFAVGGDGDRRQTGRKTLNSLQSTALIRLHRLKGMRRQVSLTPVGDAIGRALCGLPTAHDSFDLLLGPIADAYESGDGHNRGYITESRIPATVEQLLPLLARGWLLSRSDASGRIHYGLTPIVEASLDEDEDSTLRLHFEIETAEDLPSKNRQCAALYRDLLAAGLENRQLWEPEHPSSDIFIPLSAGL